jgi:hypothetical protein
VTQANSLVPISAANEGKSGVFGAAVLGRSLEGRSSGDELARGFALVAVKPGITVSVLQAGLKILPHLRGHVRDLTQVSGDANN